MSALRERDRTARAGDAVECDGVSYPVLEVQHRPQRRLLLKDADGFSFILQSFRLGKGAWVLVPREAKPAASARRSRRDELEADLYAVYPSGAESGRGRGRGWRS